MLELVSENGDLKNFCSKKFLFVLRIICITLPTQNGFLIVFEREWRRGREKLGEGNGYKKSALYVFEEELIFI